MITWDDFDKIWASTSPLTPYSFSDPNYAQGWNFIGSTPPARQMWDSIQKQNDEKFKYLRDNFGTPNIVTQASQMTDTDKVYVYLGSEAGWNNGHWYYYDEGTSSWADGGVYNSVAFVTDTTLSIAGQPADAKATGDALALKSDLAGCTFTGNVGINADLSVTGDATIGTDLSVTGVSTLTGNVSAGADVTVTGDVSSANLTTSADATIGGDLSVTGTSTLAGNITTSGDISADNISATTNATVGGNLSVTGTSTLTGNINAGADITAVGDVSADNLTTTTNATVGGSLSVAGTSTLTGNVTTNGNITAVGDISSANLTTTNATIGGNATVTGDVSCANLTTSADASVGGDLTVTGDSTLADTTVNDLVANNDLSVAGDSSLTNLSVSGTTALAGTSTAPTPSADDNSTNIATTEYVQTEIKPIEVNADIVNKRVTNIEKLLQGNLYDYQTDSNSAYTKTVLAGAMPYASLNEVGGKTVVWNQYANPSFTTYTRNGVTVTNNGDGSITVNETCSAQFSQGIVASTPFVSGHVYALTDSKNEADYDLLTLGVGFYKGETYASFVHDFKFNTIRTLTHTDPDVNRIICNVEVHPGTYNNVTIIPQLYDLTLMFGAGNEPTTVAEFQQMFPASYYSYNAGTLLSAGVTEVVSKKADTTTIATYPIPAEIQALEGYGWSAGSVYNYIDYERKVFVKRVGKTNLGDWGWNYVGTAGQERFYTAPILAIKPTASASAVANAVCALYVSTSLLLYTSSDKTLTIGLEENGGARILIRNTAYSDVTTFRTAMAGVMLYYELATPIETDISAYLTDDNLIEVEAGGTLTFPNSNGTDYQIPVPSSETYMVDLQEAI